MRSRIFSKAIACVLAIVLSLGLALAQSRVVTGVVTDQSGKALDGATVSVKNSRMATKTDANGAYSITVPSPAAVLVFSYVGGKSLEVTVGSQATILTTMEITNTQLGDVVVIGYGTTKRGNVTSSISSVTEKELKNLPVAGADQAIQGKIAGVTVTNNSGAPGGGVSVRVRGITTVNGNEPLYVIDGVPILTNTSSIAHNVLGGGGGQTAQSVLATINPNDIASIDVLKDASAQAIYGSLAANGVVLITTKRGKNNDGGKITYDFYYGWQEVPKRLDVMNLREFATYRNEIGLETGVESPEEFKNPDVLGNGTNWQDGIYQVGNVQNHQLGFSGGKDKTNFFLSLNYFNQSGTVIGSGFKRYAVRFNLDNQLKSWFKIGMSTAVSNSDQRITLTNEQDGVITTALIMNPAIPIKNPDGSWGGRTDIGGSPYGENYNPVALALLRDVTSKQTKLFGNIYGEFIFGKHFTFRNEFGYDFQLTQNKAFQPTYKMGNVSVDVNRLREDRNNSLYWVFKNYLNYNQNFGKHGVYATLGHEAQTSQWDNVFGERVNLVTDNIQALNTGSTQGQNTGGSKGDWAMESYFLRAGWNYDNRYSVNASIRRDGSSSFGPNNRIGYFPAVSAGWTISNEKFMADSKGVTYLKLRVGAGSVGNQSVGQNAAFTTKVTIRPTAFGPGGVPGNVGNPDLKWEKAITYNAGLDVTFLNRRVDLTVDVYKKISSDFLLQAILPSFTGLGTAFNDIQSPFVNAGQMTNKGIDLALTTRNIEKEHFSWKTTVIFSHYRNRLDRLNDSSSVITGTVQFGTILVSRTVPGQPVGQFYGFVTDGLFRTDEDLKAGINQGLPINPNGTWLGDVRFRNVSTNPSGGAEIIDDKDVAIIGNPHPDFTLGFTNNFQYKGFDLSLFLFASVGADILNYTRRTIEGMNDVTRNQLTTVLDRYTTNNPDGSLPRFNFTHQNNYRVSDRFVEDGSYLRIQNLSIGYNLPHRLVSKAKINNFRIYGAAQNLYTFTNYSGYDPELGSFNQDIRFMNIDNGNYPIPRTFTIGLNVEF